MNRRTFLTGLLSSAAAVSTALPVVKIVSPALSNETLLAMWEQKMRAALEVMKENLAHQIFEGNTESVGGLSTLLSSMPSSGEWEHGQIGVKIIFTEKPE